MRTDKDYSTKTLMLTEEFFKLRFPDKDIKFEKECGYFYQWCNRFDSGNPESYMDDESLKAWNEIIMNKAYVMAQLKQAEKEHDWKYPIKIKFYGSKNDSNTLSLSKAEFEKIKEILN